MRRLVRRWDIALFGRGPARRERRRSCSGAQPPLRFAYSPQAVVGTASGGGSSRHPFVHVSRYHLLLDGVAVVSLLVGLADRRARDRMPARRGLGRGEPRRGVAAARRDGDATASAASPASATG